VPVMASEKVNALCQPMKGRFSASVNADVSQDSMAEASIKSGLLRLLRLGMNEDLYVLDDVRKVSFIGDRTTFTPPPPPVETTYSAPGGTGIGNAALAFIILACLLVVLIAGFLVGRNLKKRRQEQHDRGVVLDESYALDEEEATYNKGFRGQSGDPNGANVQGSLASTDELALQPQPIVVPALSKSSEASNKGEESKRQVTAEENSTAPVGTAAIKPSKASVKKKDSTAAKELAAALLMASAAAASAEKAGEEVMGEKISGDGTNTNTPPKKKKKKKGKRSPSSSPDSLLAESLRKLDSIAEEGETSVVEESVDSGSRSLT